MADVPGFCLRLARELVAGKIRNQRTLLQRNHIEPPPSALAQMKCMMDDSERAESLDELLGIEGNAALVYFQNFAGMIKLDDHLDEAADEPAAVSAKSSETGAPTNGKAKASDAFTFDFVHRNRRPPRDPINALLSLAYSVL